MVPKWDPRSRRGIYVGHSPCHAGSVALVLNPKTLRVSPQFHVAFDDDFSTVLFLSSDDVPPNWADLVVKSESSTDEDCNLVEIWVKAQSDPTTPPSDQDGDGASVPAQVNSRQVSFDDDQETSIPKGADNSKNEKMFF